MNDNARMPEADTGRTANPEHGGASPSTRSIQQLEGKIRTLKRQIHFLNQALHERNVSLDAMHYVWCDGGCKSGTHRFTPGPITEDVVAEAERNTARLRRWLNNRKYREQHSQERRSDERP